MLELGSDLVSMARQPIIISGLISSRKRGPGKQGAKYPWNSPCHQQRGTSSYLRSGEREEAGAFITVMFSKMEKG